MQQQKTEFLDVAFHPPPPPPSAPFSWDNESRVMGVLVNDRRPHAVRLSTALVGTSTYPFQPTSVPPTEPNTGGGGEWGGGGEGYISLRRYSFLARRRHRTLLNNAEIDSAFDPSRVRRCSSTRRNVRAFRRDRPRPTIAHGCDGRMACAFSPTRSIRSRYNSNVGDAALLPIQSSRRSF